MRKAKPKKRILLPDPKFGDVAVTRFVNNLMLDGKKSIAYTIFYDSLELVGKKMKDADKSPLEIWKQAHREYHAPSRSEVEAYRWCHLPSSDGGAAGTQRFLFP